MREPSQKVAEALAVAAEVCGTTMSPAAVRVIGAELAKLPEEAVLRALTRCIRECKRSLTLGDILERIDDGRPSADEAWAIVGTDDERRTLVTTQESLEAMNVARHLLRSDEVGARMAFKRRYETLVTEARLRGTPTEWILSLGWDKLGQAGPILEAIEAGRLAPEDVSRRLGGQTVESLRLPATPPAEVLALLRAPGAEP